jgi:hypothetical protein
LKDCNSNGSGRVPGYSNGRCGRLWRPSAQSVSDSGPPPRSNGPVASCRSHHRRRKTLPKAILCALKQIQALSLSTCIHPYSKATHCPARCVPSYTVALSFVVEVTITLFPSARFYSAVSCQSPGLLPRHFHSLIATSSSI